MKNLFLWIAIISHVYDVKNSQIVCDLPTSVKDRVISPFRDYNILTKFCRNKTSSVTVHLIVLFAEVGF